MAFVSHFVHAVVDRALTPNPTAAGRQAVERASCAACGSYASCVPHGQSST